MLFESQQDTRIYKLNRSAKLNSLNLEMINSLSNKIKVRVFFFSTRMQLRFINVKCIFAQTRLGENSILVKSSSGQAIVGRFAPEET